MPSRNRGIILAFVGWLILAAAPAPNNGAQPKQDNAASQAQESLRAIASAQNRIAEATNTGEYQQPCDEAQPANRSDLCAQWFAANAARDAANYAGWSLFIGLIGAFGIVVALLLTVESNRIARDTAKRQLRAYVTLKEAHISLVQGVLVETKIDFVNAGQTPAHKLRIRTKIAWIAAGTPEVDFELDEWTPEASESSIGPGQPLSSVPRLSLIWNPAEAHALAAGTHCIIVAGEIAYEDVFNGKQITSFRFKHTAKTPPGMLQPCSTGNFET